MSLYCMKSDEKYSEHCTVQFRESKNKIIDIKLFMFYSILLYYVFACNHTAMSVAFWPFCF